MDERYSNFRNLLTEEYAICKDQYSKETDENKRRQIKARMIELEWTAFHAQQLFDD